MSASCKEALSTLAGRITRGITNAWDENSDKLAAVSKGMLAVSDSDL